MNAVKNPLVVITGSSGLIGSAVIEKLSGDFDIVGLDMKPPEGRSAVVDFIECDLTSDKSVDHALDGVRATHGSHIASLIHLAAHYDFTGEPSEMYQKLTIEGTRRLIRKLQEFDTEQIIFSSTILVQEPSEEGEPITESSPLEDEPWDYPKSKIEAERVLRTEHGEIPVAILRIAGVYDEDTHTVPIAQQIGRIYEKDIESHFFPGDASHGQAFVHLDDLATCVRLVIEKRGDLGQFEVFLVAEPDLMSYDELQDTIGKLIHGEDDWTTIWIPKFAAKAGAWAQNLIAGEDEQFIKPWMIDLADDDFPVSIEHARQTLDWTPRHSLRQTLPKMIERLKQDPKRWYEVNKLPPPDDITQQAAGV